ncbi:MAG TPA: hypothetical protein VFH62_04685 [Dehalococcoidia bacterium]|nr:hypothetical protein [Dehalococcoidia bacterium]
MTTLFTYTIVTDDGAAPNPFWGVCTLVICKPQIRKAARPGDWVIGIGSAHAPGIGNAQGKVVYAMRVSETMPIEAYDAYCRMHLPGKLPDPRSKEPRHWAGDCIYDYSVGGGSPRLRPSVHGEVNRSTDLGGKNALLSDHFFYFGDKPLDLPEHLFGMCHPTQGHRSRLNDRYVQPFVTWITSLGLEPNQLYGDPQVALEPSNNGAFGPACTTKRTKTSTPGRRAC